MGALTDMHERLNAIRLRGETPRSYELDHEEYYRLLEALKPLMKYPADDITLLLFEGVQIINKG